MMKKEAEKVYRMIRAIRILTNTLSVEEREKIDENLRNLSQLPISKLKILLPKWREHLNSLTEEYGVIGSLEELERSANVKEAHPILYIAKFRLEKIFTRYDHRFPIIKKLPPHARIGIQLGGSQNFNQMDWFLLEASLFEDMATLWNMSFDLSQSLQRIDADNKQIMKQRNALQRATIKAAFNLLEGYLNGLALDILLTQTVTDSEQHKLTEWDESNSRSKYQTLRNKLLQYPKIAMRRHEPLLTESNCPEIAAILQFEKDLRHAFIHPTPQSDDTDPTNSREITYLQFTLENTANVCDSVTDLIIKLNNAVEDKFGEVGMWLFKRDSLGKFPEEIFI